MANAGITFDFAAESAKLRSEIDKVRKEVSSISKTTKAVETGFKALGGAMAGVFAVSKITGFLSAVNQAADQLADLGDRLGANAGELQVLQIAAQQAGGSAEAMNAALEKMSVSLGDALAGNKLVNDSLARLNLSARELAGLKADEAFRRISTALSETGNSFERASIAQAIFGKGSKELAAFFADAPGAIDEAGAELERFGARLNNLEPERIGAMNDQLNVSRTVVGNLATKFLSDLAPAVLAANDSFQSVVSSVTGAAKTGQLFGVAMTAAVKAIEAGVQGLIAWFELWRALGAKLFEALTGGAAKALDAMAGVADALNLGVADSLRSASERAAGWSEQFRIGADAAFESARRAQQAAIDAGKGVLQADEIFAASSARLQAAAEEAANRAKQRQRDPGAYDPNAARLAAAKDVEGNRGSLAITSALGQFDPASDPRVLQEVQVNDALQAIQDAHNATMIGKLDAFNQTTLGMLLSNADLMQQIEYNKNATLGDAMNSLVGLAIQQGGALGKAGKALAIAQTVWSTGQAIMKAMAEVPWPGNIAAAASIAAMGVAQLANIKRTNIGGASSVAGVKGGGAPVTPALSDNVSATAPAQDMRQQSAVNIYVDGNLMAGPESVRWFAEQLGELVNGNDMVFINGTSRQAMELKG